MRTNPIRSLCSNPVILAVALLLPSATPQAWAQFGATFVSATPQTPITLGQSLSITVVVRNDTGDAWTEGELGASWLTEMDQPSWLPGAPPIDFVTTTTVPDATTASMMVSLTAAELPASPGTYSVRLYTAYNLWDLDFYFMTGGPKTVNFTINAPATTNHAPVIAPIGDRAVVVTNLLSFQVSVTETDLPPQTLTFSLDPGAPSGASINATNGMFAWIPPEGPTPRTNQITVRVTDSGSPALSATNIFNVIILAPPQFNLISRAPAGTVILAWPAFPGKTYQVSYRDSVSTGTWTNLGNNILATGPLAFLTNNPGTARQRFYRLSILD